VVELSPIAAYETDSVYRDVAYHPASAHVNHEVIEMHVASPAPPDDRPDGGLVPVYRLFQIADGKATATAAD